MMPLSISFARCFLFGNFLLFFVQSQKCSNTCTDYHRLCPGLKDSGFFNRYQDDILSGAVGVFQVNTFPAPDCNNDIYKYVCPQSCGICTPCVVSKINVAEARITSLEDQVMYLTETLKELREVKSDSKVTVSTIPIRAATSSEEYNDQYILANSHDGLVKTDMQFCFHSKASINGWVEYQINPSKVFKVGVLNPKETIGPIFVTEGQAEDGWNDQETVEAGFTRAGEEPTPSTCYHSKEKGSSGKADLIIPPSKVDRVILLNRKHVDQAKNFKGTEVFVQWSNDTSSSKSCGGKATDGPNGGWYEFNCGGIEGDRITVIHDSYYVIFCEVEVFGITQRLKGARVEVCQQRGGCDNVCGVFPEVAASSWGYVECEGAGVQGSYVRVENPGNFLQICEVDVMAAS